MKVKEHQPLCASFIQVSQPLVNRTLTLSTTSRYMDHINRQATQTELQPNMNKKDILCLSKLWKRLIYSLEIVGHCDLGSLYHGFYQGPLQTAPFRTLDNIPFQGFHPFYFCPTYCIFPVSFTETCHFSLTST